MVRMEEEAKRKIYLFIYFFCFHSWLQPYPNNIICTESKQAKKGDTKVCPNLSINQDKTEDQAIKIDTESTAQTGSNSENADNSNCGGKFFCFSLSCFFRRKLPEGERE